MSSWGTSLLGTEISKFGTDVNPGINGEKKGRVESRLISKICGWCSLDNLLDFPESADHWSLNGGKLSGCSDHIIWDELISVDKTGVVGWWHPGLTDWAPWWHHLVGLLASASVQHLLIVIKSDFGFLCNSLFDFVLFCFNFTFLLVVPNLFFTVLFTWILY